MAVAPVHLGNIRHANAGLFIKHTLKAWNSWPRVIGTASCNWVRPILSVTELHGFRTEAFAQLFNRID